MFGLIDSLSQENRRLGVKKAILEDAPYYADKIKLHHVVGGNNNFFADTWVKVAREDYPTLQDKLDFLKETEGLIV